jgi:predicted dehydrogenase
VTAVADVVPATLARRMAELDVAGYDDVRAMLAGADIDAVDICLPHHLHAGTIVAAAEAGKHILCEKPLCLTLDEARMVREAVRQAGVTLMCAHNQLFLPAVAEARRLLADGAIGPIYEVRTTDCFYSDFDPASMGWRASAATSGGGELIDTGYHPTYLMMHLAGGTPVEVAAMLSNHRLTFAEGEDSAQLLIRFNNGAVGQLATSWAYDPPPVTERFSAVGPLGSLHSDGVSLTVNRRGAEPQTFVFDEVDTFAAEIRHFADALLNGTRPLHTEVEGIAVLGIILAGYESARTRTVAAVVGV